MKGLKDLQEKILNVSPPDFDALALEIFQYQAAENPVYANYLRHLNVSPGDISELQQIPFLPIELFKTQKVCSGSWESEAVFESSGTGYGLRSKHYVQDMAFYQAAALKAFERLYGPVGDYTILALLPSYLERQNSSLVAMVQFFIDKAGDPLSGFFLHDQQALLNRLEAVKQTDKKALLIGVSFALLELAESGAGLQGAIVMETGGMKGRRKELIRAELHEELQSGLGVETIHSEYGMTELLSQAYAQKNGIFETPNWMKVLIRDVNDPFAYVKHGRTGGVNVIDLANVHSCSFIETQDLGISHPNSTFEILGRFDNSELRGCNLLQFS